MSRRSTPKINYITFIFSSFQNTLYFERRLIPPSSPWTGIDSETDHDHFEFTTSPSSGLRLTEYLPESRALGFPDRYQADLTRT